jgi:hypothetical protein
VNEEFLKWLKTYEGYDIHEWRNEDVENAFLAGKKLGHAAAIAEIKAKFPSENLAKMVCLDSEMVGGSAHGHQHRFLGWQLCYDYLKQKLFGDGGE